MSRAFNIALASAVWAAPATGGGSSTSRDPAAAANLSASVVARWPTAAGEAFVCIARLNAKRSLFNPSIKAPSRSA